MCIPARFKDDSGRVESANSYLTFLNHFVAISPRPTIKDVAKSSGFKVNTVSGWFAKNKFIKRYNDWYLEHKAVSNKSVQETAKILTESALNMVKCNVTAANGFLMKHRDVMRGFSANDDLQLEYLDINSREYKIICNNDVEAGRKPIRILEALNSVLDTYDRLIDETNNRELLNEALERNNNPRFNENLKTVKAMYKEYENVSF